MAESNVPLRDFDEESETDSETELLIRRDVPSGKQNNNNNRGRRKSSMGYSGVDAGAGSSAAGGGGSFLGNLFGSNSFGSAAGQIRYRNERSRERAKHSNGSYSSISKLAQLTHTSSRVAGAGSIGGVGGGSGGGGGGSGSATGIKATTGDGSAATSGGSAATGDLSNGATHSTTVIDPENGSSTVFYQHNRRKSKSRSIGNVCKLCLCR
ncbi:GM10389 [Drosophila sechellia]|uniref:GM10389 n=1 Tax=Drosophila sechellia TaxID=7238 RepID=B4IEI9_DROSE|nr:GM10389 [Drosophila sechellia]